MPWLGYPRSGWTRGSGECCSPLLMRQACPRLQPQEGILPKISICSYRPHYTQVSPRMYRLSPRPVRQLNERHADSHDTSSRWSLTTTCGTPSSGADCALRQYQPARRAPATSSSQCPNGHHRRTLLPFPACCGTTDTAVGNKAIGGPPVASTTGRPAVTLRRFPQESIKR